MLLQVVLIHVKGNPQPFRLLTLLSSPLTLPSPSHLPLPNSFLTSPDVRNLPKGETPSRPLLRPTEGGQHDSGPATTTGASGKNPLHLQEDIMACISTSAWKSILSLEQGLGIVSNNS